MFASIFIPHFPVQALVRNEPELTGQPIVVVDGTPPVLTVVEANAKARAAGIEMGMAKLKVEHFFHVIVRQRSHAQEASAHAALIDCAERFSPRVEDTALDTVVMDLTGLDRLFGSYHEIAAQTFDQVAAMGLECNVAIAADIDAAVHASRGFQGLIVIPRGTEQKRLEELPLHVLAPPLQILETLERWGIRTFGAFAKLPPSQVSVRLGQQGVQLQKLTQGAGSRPLVPYAGPLQFEEVVELDHTIVLLEPLAFILSRLLDQLCKRLRARNRATHEIRLALDLDDRALEPHKRALRLPLPLCDPKLLLKLLLLDLESHPPQAGVVKVTAEAVPTNPRIVQNGLFVPLSPEPEKLELTLARITHVVGKDNVGTPQVLDTYRPDAWKFSDFGLRIADFKNGTGEHLIKPVISLGFRHFRPALEATVQLRNRVPAWIAFHGMYGPITTASGPWCASGDWWNEAKWDREEWDILVESRTKTQTLCRIYRDCANRRWFVEGVYD
jgi:protein ImuB